MKYKLPIVLLLVMAAWPGLSAPCSAQISDLPVLKEYPGKDWIYFASAHDDGLIFKNQPSDGSNVWIAAERTPLNRRILAKADVWTDSRGRLHTVGVLRAQMEYNDHRQALGNFRMSIDETGVLDSKTLAIPNMKMYARVDSIKNRLHEEDDAVKLLEASDANAASVRKKFSAYLWEKVWVATARLDELNRAIFAVPQTIPGADKPPIQLPDAGAFSGLRGLETPTVNPYALKRAGGGPNEIRFVYVDERYTPEKTDSKVVDPMQMTPEILEDIRTKEAVAERAVIFAENLCKDLLTPPCQ